MRRFTVGPMFATAARALLAPIAPFLLRRSMIFMADVTDEFYASEAFIGYGAQFEVGQGDSPETFVAVPEVMDIAPLVSMTTPTIPVTHLRSPDRHEELIATISKSGPIVMNGTYRPGHGAHKLAGGDGFDASHNLQALRASAARNNFRIVLPEAAGLEGSPASAIALPLVGIVTKYEIGKLDNNGVVPFTLEVTPSRSYFSR